MVRFIRTTAGTPMEIYDRRGAHFLVFEEDDQAEKLMQAQKQWSWAAVTTAGSDRLHTVPYAEFMRVIGRVMWVEGLGFPTKDFTTHCVGEAGLDRSWKALIAAGHVGLVSLQTGRFRGEGEAGREQSPGGSRPAQGPGVGPLRDPPA